MKQLAAIAFSAFVLLGGSVHAMDGAFDRSVEVDKYIQTIKTGTRNTVTEAAREIVDTDIGDPRLAQALYEKLAADLATLNEESSVDVKYRKTMIIALASTGVAEYAVKLVPICDGIKSKRKPNFCDAEVGRMSSYRRKNELLASTRYHHEGDNPRASRIMNLLMADDFALKQEGATRMNFGKILEPRLMEAIAPQVLQYMDSTKHGASAAQVAAIAGYVKLLGFSGDPKYRSVLEKVHSSHAGALIQKRAREALIRLKTQSAT